MFLPIEISYAPLVFLQYSKIVDFYDIPVICYGLRSDFQCEPFEGSKYLMAIADEIEEIKTLCSFCNKKATINARFINDKITNTGEQIMIGDSEYKAVCRKCYNNLLKMNS